MVNVVFSKCPSQAGSGCGVSPSSRPRGVFVGLLIKPQGCPRIQLTTGAGVGCESAYWAAGFPPHWTQGPRCVPLPATMLGRVVDSLRSEDCIPLMSHVP